MKDEVDRLNGIIEQVNAFAHPPQLKFASLDVSRVVQKAMQQAAARLHTPHGVELQTAIEADLPRINADERAMVECIANLVVNAVEAVTGQDGARVTVAGKVVDGNNGDSGVAITVADNGGGISPDIRDRVFSPFCTTKCKGMGLGLPIVKRTVMDHNGEIRVDTSEQGTAVTLVIPAQGCEKPHEAYSDRR